MKYFFLFFIVAFLSPTVVFGQLKHDYVWLNGDDGTSSDSNPKFGINMLDFNDGELNITRAYRDSDFDFTNASISSAVGELLFYTNGCSIFQADGEVMENGTDLNPGIAYDLGFCPKHGFPLPNTVMILPLPESDSLFYIFHKSVSLGDGNPLNIYNGLVYTTVVDMSLNGGLGAVLEKNDTIIADTLFNDLHAVRHANGEDWWVVTSDGVGNVYRKILFTSDGVAGVFEQSIGPSSDIFGGGMSCFSPDGMMFARYDLASQVLLYDFDRESGELSNLRQMTADTTFDNRWGYGVAFSPSSQFLYVSSLNKLYQFDVEATDIQGSRVFLAEYDGYRYLNTFESNFGVMRLAPDCKIYMAALNSIPAYHVIHYPDRKGLDCNFVQRGFPMPAYNIGSIPNFPNYRLGTGFPVCDSTIQLVVSSVPVLPPVREVLVYPNPASSYAVIEMPWALVLGGEWSLYNGVGQRVLSQEMGRGEMKVTVDLASVPKGLYFWEMRGAKGRMGSGKLIVLE